LNHRTVFILGVVLILALSVYYAPSYLVVSDQPVESDAVVIFPGNEKGTREKEAHQLVREGLAEYLINPGRRQIHKRNPDGKLDKINIDSKLETSNLKLETTSWFEDTHKDALVARDMMEGLGIQSAIFVSSPYHMRRIKLIAGKIFKDSLAVRYVPTRYESIPGDFWFMDAQQVRWVASEYAKIIWFLIYSPFV
jgi:uncharacterized SAM-binding protein YcdF (DUF218 family)